MPGQPRAEAVLDTIGTYRPTVFFGLPTLFTSITRHPAAQSADLSSIRQSMSAAEILSEEVYKAWVALTGHGPTEGLGSTELLHVYLSNRRCLAEHPDIHEVCVLAHELADKRMTLRAVVHLRDGLEPGEWSDASIKAFVKERLQPFKYPRLIEYCAALPKTGTGKIDRRALAQAPQTPAPAL